MHASTILSVLSAAMVVSASPAVQARTGSGGSPPPPEAQCQQGQQLSCCEGGGVLSQLICNLPLLGQGCNNDAYCCDVDENGLINVGTCGPLLQL